MRGLWLIGVSVRSDTVASSVHQATEYVALVRNVTVDAGVDHFTCRVAFPSDRVVQGRGHGMRVQQVCVAQELVGLACS